MAQLNPGDRIQNYRLEEMVGAGSFAEVWRARHHTLEKVVAIKVLIDPQYIRNFRREGVVVHGLRHPNIVRVEDLDTTDDPPYIVMEYVDGCTLRDVIDANPNGLPVNIAVTILRGLCSGLKAAHGANLIHRDVKPENILLARAADEVERIRSDEVKIGDFGLGKTGGVTTTSILQSGSLQTEEGKSIAGTLAYMSPEQKEGRDLDPRSDLYACGIILFEMLTASRPAGTEALKDIRPDIPSNIEMIFARTYTRLDLRMGSAQDLLDALDGHEVDLIVPSGRSTGIDLKVCPECNQKAREGDQFCIHCGFQLVDHVPRCNACGAFVNADDRYCIFCGTRLEQ